MANILDLGKTMHTLGSHLKEFSSHVTKPKTVTSHVDMKSLALELRNGSKIVAKELKSKLPTDYDKKLVESSLIDIRKLKKTRTPLGKAFLTSLNTYETKLEELKNRKFAKSSHDIPIKVKPMVRKDEDLGAHLKQLKEVLDATESEGEGHVKELTHALSKTNVVLAKAVAFQSMTSHQYNAVSNVTLIEGILKQIRHIEKIIGVQIQAGTTSVQTNFRFTIRESKALLAQVLRYLKASRGKKTAKTEQGKTS